MSNANPDTNNTADQTDASALPKRDRKRPRETDDSPQSSKYKKNEKVDNEAAGSSTEQNALKLLDLHIDCLEHIFGYLNYADLANVAELDANALAAAQLVFSRRFSNSLVEMYTNYTIRSTDTTRPTIALSSVSECGKILRHFGKSIKKLELNDFRNVKMASTIGTHNWNAIKNLIDKNCTKTLVELTLYKCEQQFSDGIENVFKNVETLRLQYTSLGKWKELNKCFPKLKRLELIHNENPLRIIVSPEMVTQVMRVHLSQSDIKAMIKSAPQLHTLTLTGRMNANYLRFINDSLPMLKRLILPNFEFSENPTETKVRFKNLETFSILDLGTTFKLDIPFEFEQLKEFDIDGVFMDTKWIDFAIEQRDLIKLRLKSQFSIEMTERQVNEMATNLTKLTEIKVDIKSEVPLDHVIALLNCQSLKKLEVRSLSPINGKRAVALATGKWLFCENDQQGVFTRESTDN